MSVTARVLLEDRSAIGAARSATRRAAVVCGFTEHRLSEALVVTAELTTNVLTYAGRGHFVVRARPGLLTLVAWDDGPGIGDVERAFEDGYTTRATPGSGLGAVRRMADAVRVRSATGEGTIIAADFGVRPTGHAGWAIDGMAIPLGGDGPCGDAFALRVDGGDVTLMLADGLGHGAQAAEAADRATDCLLDGPDRGPAEVLAAMDAALRRTRGAAVSVARVEPGAGRVRFAGRGNVAGLLVDATSTKTMLGLNGIVGRGQHRARETAYPLDGWAMLLLHTDGIRSGWQAAGRRGILQEDPLVVAADVARGCERGRDDVGVVVASRVGAP